MSQHNLHLLFCCALSILLWYNWSLFYSLWVLHTSFSGGRSLSDSKSPQLSWTLLCILIYLSNAVVWIILIFTLISSSSVPFSRLMGTVPSTLTQFYYLNSHVPFCFQFFGKVKVFVYLSFSFCGPPEQDGKNFLLINTKSSGRDLVICAYLKIPKYYNN